MVCILPSMHAFVFPLKPQHHQQVEPSISLNILLKPLKLDRRYLCCAKTDGCERAPELKNKCYNTLKQSQLFFCDSVCAQCHKILKICSF